MATLLLAVAAPPLADVALEFGPAEYFSLMVLGLVASVALASGSLLKAFTMIVLGLLLGLVGTDVDTGTQRFTFDMPEMADGLDFVALAWAFSASARSCATSSTSIPAASWSNTSAA